MPSQDQPPREHGAIAMASLATLGGAVMALQQAPAWQVAFATLGLGLLFWASPGLSRFACGKALSTRALALALAGSLLALLPLGWSQPAARPLWLAQLSGCGLLACLALMLRARLGQFHPASIGLGSLALSLPALHLASLAQGPGPEAWGFWAWAAVFFPCASLSAQACLRGWGPKPWPLAGAALLASAAFGLGAPLAACLLLAWCLRITYLAWPKQPVRGRQVQRLGWEQAAWVSGLAAWWIFESLGR